MSPNPSNEELCLRVAQEADARALRVLLEQVSYETPYLVDASAGERSWEQEADLIATYQQDPHSIMLVAQVADDLIGLGELSVLDQDRQNHVAELGICILKDYWGLGIGKLFMESLLEFAQASGLKVITLEVLVDNERAIRLYQAFGFEIRGRLSQRLRVDSNYLDVYTMERVLS